MTSLHGSIKPPTTMSRTTSTSRKRKSDPAPTLACILCKAPLVQDTQVAGFWLHPDDLHCTVRITDSDGVSVDDRYERDPSDGVIYELVAGDDGDATTAENASGFITEVSPGEALLMKQLEATAAIQSVDPLAFTGKARRANPGFVIDIESMMTSPFTSAEWALAEIFEAAGVPRLGGASGGRGWSAISTFQKCPYLYRRRYMDTERGILDHVPKSPALEIGTLVHVLLAVTSAGKIDPSYPLTATSVRDQLLAKMVNPEDVNEAWRVVTGYWAYYPRDKFVPLAVEHLVVDPKTGDSCRLDEIWWLDEPEPGFQAGVFIVDHKTAARFDNATLEGWPNDGEIVGLCDLWDRTKMAKRFGQLQGVIINILGKQKELQFERRLVRPSRALIKDHRKSLQIWNASIDMAKALGSFPRARAACVQRYGYLCDEFEHCVQRED